MYAPIGTAQRAWREPARLLDAARGVMRGPEPTPFGDFGDRETAVGEQVDAERDPPLPEVGDRGRAVLGDESRNELASVAAKYEGAEVPAVVEPGDVVFFGGRVLHRLARHPQPDPLAPLLRRPLLG
jgi:hypothetical protein